MNASVSRVKVFIWMVIIQIRWKFNTHQIHLYRLSAAALIQRAAWEGPQKRKKKILASSLICRFSLDDKLGWKLSKRNKRHTNLGQRQSIFFAKKMSFFFFPLFFSFSSCVSQSARSRYLDHDLHSFLFRPENKKSTVWVSNSFSRRCHFL